jgi:tetratricopeptide (TPR) repeat protein
MEKRARPKAARPVRKTRGTVTPPRESVAEKRAAQAPRLLPPPEAPDPQAITYFQQAMEALHRKRYREAAGHFQTLLTRFPGERGLLDRSRTYLELAEREMNRRDVNPRTIEERVTAATAALNTDQDAEAERLVRSVLGDQPEHDLALYLMAALEARRGDHAGALSFLSRAIGVSPEVRAQARYDSDFESLRRSEPFQQLVDPPNGGGLARRGRRPR